MVDRWGDEPFYNEKAEDGMDESASLGDRLVREIHGVKGGTQGERR